MTDEDRQDILDRLHVDPDLSGAPNYHLSGNGAYESCESKIILSVQDCRINRHPNARSSNKEAIQCRYQNIFDAIVGLANVSEIVTPLVWQENEAYYHRNRISSQRGETNYSSSRFAGAWKHSEEDFFFGDGGCILKSINKEVEKFVNRFGLLHSFIGRGIDDGRGWYKKRDIKFLPGNSSKTFDEFRQLRADEIGFWTRYELLSMRQDEDVANITDKNIKMDKAIKASTERMRRKNQPWILSLKDKYLESLESFIKDFSGVSSWKSRSKELRDKYLELEEEIFSLYRKQNFALLNTERKKIDKRINQLRNTQIKVHFELPELIKSAERAKENLSNKSDALLKNGIWLIGGHCYYNASLLIHDALELLAASRGDENSLNRIVNKFHCSKFDCDNQEVKDTERYVLWFESIGRDHSNPSNENLRTVCQVFEMDRSYKLTIPADSPLDSWNYGWKICLNCSEDDIDLPFSELVRKHIRYFLEELIKLGKTNNYKGRFREAVALDPKEPYYRVNDYNYDLFATMWTALEMVVNHDVSFEFARCEQCGRLMRVVRNKNAHNARHTCSSACRKQLSRNADPMRKEKELKNQYYEYLKSGLELRGVDYPGCRGLD